MRFGIRQLNDSSANEAIRCSSKRGDVAASCAWPRRAGSGALPSGLQNGMAVFYSIVMTVNGLAWVSLWLHASTDGGCAATSSPRNSAAAQPS